MSAWNERVSVVVATRNRRDTLLATLSDLARLPERPALVVVDNGSRDGTAQAIRSRRSRLTLIELATNRGAAARNLGVLAAQTPYVAFADDDSGWSPGSLARAAELLDAYPRLAVIAARILVGGARLEDPTCTAMASSPLPGREGEPGVPVLGFVACGAVVRRSAFLDVGGFSERLWFSGEEALLAIDLASAGWRMSYCPDVVAFHDPSPKRDLRTRTLLQARNALWLAWLRRPLPRAVRETLRATRPAFHDQASREGLVAALRGLGPVLRERRRIPAEIESALVTLERASRGE